MSKPPKCFSCGGALPREPSEAYEAGRTRPVQVCADCSRQIKRAGVAGHLPKLGGPLLYAPEALAEPAS